VTKVVKDIGILFILGSGIGANKCPKKGGTFIHHIILRGIGTISPEHIVSEQLVSRATSKMDLLADVQVYENDHYPELVDEIGK
jgi:hypothetical protein